MSGVHICADYRAEDGFVFVHDGIDEWKMVPREDNEQGDIIKCVCCDAPAIKLDHYYPWFAAGNRCSLHIKGPEGWARIGCRKYHYYRKDHSLCWRWQVEFLRVSDVDNHSVDDPENCVACANRLRKEIKRLEKRNGEHFV